MASDDDFQSFVLKAVTPLDCEELGRGAYGRVYAVKYCEMVCAAKEIHSILVEEVGHLQMQQTVDSFLRECRQCSTLRHPNVIQFLGVYYPSIDMSSVQRRMRLPVMVMEMMADSLTSLVDKYEKIPVQTKFSIVHDGLCYLHNHDPPIVHRDLSPNNILLTVHHVAKISDLGVAKVIKADSRKTMTKVPGTVDFMPPESLSNNPVYGPPLDVFSFAGIILHTFNQQWPHPIDLVQYDHKTRKMVALSEVLRRQQYLDNLRGEAEVLRPLVEECLDCDPAMRPTIATICERIKVSKDVCMKEPLQDVITLHQRSEQKDIAYDHLKRENDHKNLEINQLKSVNDQLKCKKDSLKSENDRLRQQLYSIRHNLGTVNSSKLRAEAPPLMPTITSGRYHIKWTQLANLPAPIYYVCVTVQDKKVYVAGGDSPVDNAQRQVYVYDFNTDHWSQLPTSGHCYGIPHIIGGKLAIIGGRLSSTMKRTNKVSTFDEASQSWASYYPDLLSIRSKPGVVTHLEHVIVAGGGLDDKNNLDDIEVLNWIENSHWIKVAINLPRPMGGFTPIISSDHYVIAHYTGVYILPVSDITSSNNQQPQAPTKWVIKKNTQRGTILVPSSSPLVTVGGYDQSQAAVSDIKMYDESIKSWRNIASLSSTRAHPGVAVINDNAIIVIGGCTKTGSVEIRKSSSLMTVEIGQAELT